MNTDKWGKKHDAIKPLSSDTLNFPVNAVVEDCNTQPPQTRSQQQRRADRSALIVPDELLHFPANARSPVCDWEEARNGGKFLPPWRCHFPTLQLAACQTHRPLTRGGVDSERRGGATGPTDKWTHSTTAPRLQRKPSNSEKHDDCGNESVPLISSQRVMTFYMLTVREAEIHVFLGVVYGYSY